MPQLFISHSVKDDLAAEALRTYLAGRGWSRKEIFIDASVDGIAAHERWKASLAEAAADANALLCLASPDWLASQEAQVERRVVETLKELNPQRTRAVLVAIWRGVDIAQMKAKGFGGDQIVDLSAAGESILVPASKPSRKTTPASSSAARAVSPTRSASSTACGAATARTFSPLLPHRAPANRRSCAPGCGRGWRVKRASGRSSSCVRAPASSQVARGG